MADVSFRDYLIEVRNGNIAGHSVEQKFGRNTSVANGIWSLVSSVSLNEALPMSGSPVRIKAGGSIHDISGGSGVGLVTVLGTNSSLIESSEDIVTSGSSASLATSTSFWRIYRVSTSQAGTYNGANSGNITMETAGGDSNRLVLATDEGQTQHGAYSIPDGKTGYLLSMQVTADGLKAADFRLFVRENLTNVQTPFDSKRLKLYFDGIAGQANYLTYSPTIIIPALSDIWVEARGGGASTEVSINFEILLIDNLVSHIRRI